MDLSQVKLVVTDMDGTLLNSKHEISSTFFNLYNQLKNQIHFVAASGRQYQSILRKFNSIKNEISIIAENGGIVMQGNNELLFTELSLSKIHDIIPIVRNIKGSFPVLCGKKGAYIETENSTFNKTFKEYYDKYEIVDDLTKVTNDAILKIAIFHFESSEKYLYPSLKQFENDLKIKVSGKNWLDISHTNANKGYALALLQQKLGITKAETMVFGDYNNDLEMLALADFSFAMKNAHPNVKKIANFSTKSNNELGVEIVLEQLLKAKLI